MPTVALISSDTNLRDRMVTALEVQAAVTSLAPTDDLLRKLATAKPALVLVDLAEQSDQAPEAIRRAVEAAHAADARLEVVALGDPADANLVITALRAGATDFVDRAADAPALRAQIIQRVSGPPVSRRGGAGDFTVVIGASSASFASLLAVNFALWRAKVRDEALLIDCALPTTEADAALDLSPSYTLWDAVRDLDRLDRTLLNSALAAHPAGLRLLPLAASTTPDAALSPEHFLRTLRTVRPLFRETVLYLGGVRHPQVLAEVSAIASRILLVTPQTFTALRDAKGLLDGLPGDGEARRRTTLVVEEYSPGISLTDAQMAQTLALGQPVRLPPARDALLNSLNVGRPLALDAAGGAYARAIEALACEPASVPARAPLWPRLRESLGLVRRVGAR